MDSQALLRSALLVIEQYAAAHQQLIPLLPHGRDCASDSVLSLLEDASAQRHLLLSKLSSAQQKDADDLKQARAHIQLLMSVCAEAYQMAGALDASIPALDNLSAAANGETKLPHSTFLPHPCNEVAEHLKVQMQRLEEALSFYANGEHYAILGKGWQNNVPGDAPNWLYNTDVEEGDELIEDGSIAKQALHQLRHDASATVIEQPPRKQDNSSA